MAQFIYEGEASMGFEFVASFGTTTEIKVRTKTGSQTLSKPSGFTPGQVVTDEGGTPIDFTDETTLRSLRSDPRFTEV